MSAHKPTAFIALIVVCVLAGCSARAGVGTEAAAVTPSPVVTPNPVATPTAEPVSAAQIVAVAQQFWPEPASANRCQVFDCPITARLAARQAEVMQEQGSYPTGGTPGWCRCQQYFSVTITADVTPGGGTAHVTSDTGIEMDFIMVEQDGRLLVDDTQCTGQGPSTSVYAPVLVLC